MRARTDHFVELLHYSFVKQEVRVFSPFIKRKRPPRTNLLNVQGLGMGTAPARWTSCWSSSG